MFIARLHLVNAARLRVSAALLFADMKKAYYSVSLELVLGPLLTPIEREAVLAGKKGMDSLRKGAIQSEVIRGQCPFTALGVEVVAGWQRLAWYTIEGSPNSFVHNIGV